MGGCEGICKEKAAGLFQKLSARAAEASQRQTEELRAQIHEAAKEKEDAMSDLLSAQGRMVALNRRISDRAAQELKNGDTLKYENDIATAHKLMNFQDQINEHLAKVKVLGGLAKKQGEARKSQSFLQLGQSKTG